MAKEKKRRKGIGGFISSEKGQRFFNFAYSIGAAIVIWGALFKILHLPGGNTLLSIGMGTEVVMFLLTAFDRPPKEYKWEEVFPVLDSKNPEDRPDFADGMAAPGGTVIIGGAPASDADFPSGSEYDNGASEYDNGALARPVHGAHASHVTAVAEFAQGAQLEPEQAASLTESIAKLAGAADQLSKMADLAVATQTYLDQMSQIAGEMQRLRHTTTQLNDVSDVLLQSYQAITQHSNEINESSTGYVEQMQNLNRNISGLNTIYEIQLKSVSSQLDAIDRVNRGIKEISEMYQRSAAQSNAYCEETEKMAMYMQQLNNVYAKMITAMTGNMYGAMPTPPMPQPPVEPAQPDSQYE